MTQLRGARFHPAASVVGMAALEVLAVVSGRPLRFPGPDPTLMPALDAPPSRNPRSLTPLVAVAPSSDAVRAHAEPRTDDERTP